MKALWFTDAWSPVVTIIAGVLAVTLLHFLPAWLAHQRQVTQLSGSRALRTRFKGNYSEWLTGLVVIGCRARHTMIVSDDYGYLIHCGIIADIGQGA